MKLEREGVHTGLEWGEGRAKCGQSVGEQEGWREGEGEVAARAGQVVPCRLDEEV